MVADIGGSNARFGWLAPGSGKVQHVAALAVDRHPTLLDAARAYLAELQSRLGPDYRCPGQAALAVATAVTGDAVEFTNSAWHFSQQEVRDALGLQRLAVVNDFEALALALPHLQPDQWRCAGAAPGRDGTMAVIGPGTGLGVASVAKTGSGWAAVPGEGGHATLAAADDFESAVLAQVRRAYEHVSAERLLSGIGLPLLHDAVAAVCGRPAAPSLETPVLVQRALAGEPACVQTVELFCALLGGFAGNVALTVGARGGVFIGGGIVPRLGDLFFASRFRERFVAKGRLRPYLDSIRTAVIVDTLAALTGAAAVLADSAGSRR